MATTLAGQPILNGGSVLVNQLTAVYVSGGTTYYFGMYGLMNDGSVVSGSNPVPVEVVATTPTLAALDATVVNPGTNTVALNAGHATAGGFIVNTGSETLTVNQIGAAGTTVGGSNIPLAPYAVYEVVPSANAVNVNSTGTTAVTLAGYGKVA